MVAGRRAGRVRLARGLSVVAAEGTGRLRLTRRGGDGGASWSPDGQRIAYAAEDGLWVIGSDGRVRTLLTHLLSGASGGPVWAPDGNRIAFIGGDPEAEAEDLYIVEVGGVPRRLVRNASGVPTWSPDGAQLAFLSFPPIFDASAAGIVVVDARDGRPIRKLSGTADPPIWSPDGEHLLLASAPTLDSGPKELPQVLIMSHEGSERRQLTRAYPDGGSNRPIGWIASEHATEQPPRPAIEPLPNGARLLRVPQPVGVARPRATGWSSRLRRSSSKASAHSPRSCCGHSTAARSTGAWSRDAEDSGGRPSPAGESFSTATTRTSTRLATPCVFSIEAQPGPVRSSWARTRPACSTPASASRE